MKRVSLLLAGILVLPALLCAAEPSWPQASGPDGSFTPQMGDGPFVDDMAKAKLLWVSESKGLGYSKTSPDHISFVMKRDNLQGAGAGPVVAGGRVFVSTFRPSGEAWVEGQTLKGGKKPDPNDKALRERMKARFAIGADDVVVAMDLKTGKTLWEAVEKDAGAHYPAGKRGGWAIAPACDEERVYSYGTLGVMRAYDAATGKKMWETPMPGIHEALVAIRKAALESKTAADVDCGAGMVLADAVLVAPLIRTGDGAGNMGLAGLDRATGKVLWTVPDVCAHRTLPGLWKHEGKTYLITATKNPAKQTGIVRCLEAATGKELWKMEGLAAQWRTPLVNGDIALVMSNSRAVQAGPNRVPGQPTGLRLSLKGATAIWTLPDESRYCQIQWKDGGAHHYSAMGEKAFYLWVGELGLPQRAQPGIIRVNRDTGAIEGDVRFDAGTAYLTFLGANRLLYNHDLHHNHHPAVFGFRMLSADPLRFTDTAVWYPPEKMAVTYESTLEPALVGGLMLLRSEAGALHCYDLRAGK